MDVFHRISFNNEISPKLLKIIKDLKIEYEVSDLPGGDYLVHFNIYESDPRWKKISNNLGPPTVNLYQTTFLKEEILEAEWVRVIPDYQKGFPEPQNEWSDSSPNYDIFCKECRSYEQISSFRIKGEPAMKGKAFMSLHWAYPLFGIQEVIQTLKENEVKGIEIWDVIINKTDQQSDLLKQLFIPNNSDPGLLDGKKLNPVNCKSCNVLKYKSHMRGYMNVIKEAFDDKDVDFLNSFEWFGERKVAFREILISNKVAALIIENDWKGVHLKPVKLI